MNKPIVAICYDFDNTLSPKSMQEYGFIDKLGITPQEFWDGITRCVEKYQADRTTAFLFYMIELCKEKNIKFTKKDLEESGKYIELFEGVESWFKRINEFAQANNMIVEHYIISSGNKEILSHTKIANEFTDIYASTYMWDDNNNPIWPAMSVNYTNKTQYLYRINKGISSVTDDSVNKTTPESEKRIPFKNIIYIGDSFTDVPCMRLVMKKGGNAIGVYDKNSLDLKTILDLNDNNRIPYFVPANYTVNSEIDKLINQLILKIRIETNLSEISCTQKKALSNLKNNK